MQTDSPPFEQPPLNPVRSREQFIVSTRPKIWRTLFVMLMLSLWEAFPLAVIGVKPSASNQLYAVITALGVALCLVPYKFRNRSIDLYSTISIVLFLWCFAVSFNYSTFISPQPFAQWIFALYSVTPLLNVFLLRRLGITIFDVQRAILWMGVFASLLAITESFTNTGFLDYYIRGSTFGDKKIVFFKLISTFAMIIAFASISNTRNFKKIVVNFFIMIVTGYNGMFMSESRIIIFSTFLSFIFIWFFIFRGAKKYIMAMIAPLALVPIAFILLSKFFSNFINLEQYLKSDRSASWREITAEHYSKYFSHTDGMGFGFMSGNADYQNLISYSTHKASSLYGVDNYTLTLDDIGIYSAFYQYGYVGGLLIICMSVLCMFELALSLRLGRQYAAISAMGILMGALMLNPFAMNYFTLAYTAHLGGILWFLASEIRRIASHSLPR